MSEFLRFQLRGFGFFDSGGFLGILGHLVIFKDLETSKIEEFEVENLESSVSRG